MLPKALILDDERTIRQVWARLKIDDKPDTQAAFYWDQVYNYDGFVNWVTVNGVPNFVSFDHDLADIQRAPNGLFIASDWTKEQTGADCAEWLIHYCREHNEAFPHYTIHSANPEGAKNIESKIQSAKKAGYIK